MAASTVALCWPVYSVSTNSLEAGSSIRAEPFFLQKGLKIHVEGKDKALMVDSNTFSRLLHSCVKTGSLAEGRAVHALMIKSVEIDTFLGNSLANMYSKFGSMEDAGEIFDGMPAQNAVSWNVMIAGYVQQGRGKETLELLEEMQRAGIMPNEFAFGSFLKACSSEAALEEGKQVHCHIAKSGLQQHVFLGSALVDMYGKCGSIEDACHVFDKMSQRNVVSWNAMIAGYVQHGRGQDALKLFGEMLLRGTKPSHITFGSVLKACGSREALNWGKQLHACAVKYEFVSHLFVGSALIVMYTKCGRVDDATQVFYQMPEVDLGLFNAAIQGYVHGGHDEEALSLFYQLLWASMRPNEVTYAVVLRACASLKALETGKQVHAHVIKTIFHPSISVGSALINMYARCGGLNEAHRVFGKMAVQDVVLWTAMLAGYAQNGASEKALRLFLQMLYLGLKPNQFTFPSVLSACGSLAALEQGKQVHGHVIKTGVESDVFVSSGLVDMYAKCGSIKDSRQVFDRMPKRDIISWNSMIAGYAQHGCAREALLVFGQMQQSSIKPNHNTFIGVLSACGHLGLVGLGHRYFNSLSRVHGITPSMEHYACMVDLLCRAGRLYEAEDFIYNMPVQPGAMVWKTLLRACRIHGNTKLGQHAVECLVQSE